MSITLDYFDIRGYGEYIRTLLIDQNIPYTENRFGWESEEWEKLKDSMPWGQVPRLTIGDKSYVQTGAIMRILGRRFDLYGATQEEAAFIDVFFECVRNFRDEYVRYIYFADETKEHYDTVTLPAGLTRLSKLLTSDYVNGDKISIADYMLFEELDISIITCPGSLDKFENLKNFHKRMLERPNLKNHVATRTLRINAVPNY